jgi:hypothetical protein
MSDNQHLFVALKNALTRIQERKAHDEVRSPGISATDSSRPSTNETSNLLSPTRSLSRRKDENDRSRVVGFMQGEGV